MKNQMTKIGKIQFVLPVPETIAEFNAIHGSEDAVLKKAINYDVAHTILGKIRAKVADALIAKGAEKDIKTTLPDGTKIYKPTDTKWIDRQIAALGIDATEQSAMYQTIADAIGYDVSGTREAKPYNAIDLKDAKSLIENVKLGRSTFVKLKGSLEARNPGLVLALDENETCTAEELAAALKVERARAEAARQAELAGLGA